MRGRQVVSEFRRGAKIKKRTKREREREDRRESIIRAIRGSRRQ